jgi:hypothetical protein
MLQPAPPWSLIPLTRGYFAVVDDVDLARLACFKWYAHVSSDGQLVYAARATYPGGYRNRVLVLMHREVAGASADQVVDHRNGDTLDNRRKNVRACTQRQNRQNRRKVVAASGFKGVQRASRHRLEASIRVDGERKSLGYFKRPEDAARAYDAAAIAYFGEFAATNLGLGRYEAATAATRSA